MKIILDVSAAFVVVTGAPSSGHFLPRLESATQVSAPDLFYSEATNTAWKFHHVEEASLADKRLIKITKKLGIPAIGPEGPVS